MIDCTQMSIQKIILNKYMTVRYHELSLSNPKGYLKGHFILYSLK